MHDRINAGTEIFGDFEFSVSLEKLLSVEHIIVCSRQLILICVHEMIVTGFFRGRWGP